MGSAGRIVCFCWGACALAVSALGVSAQQTLPPPVDRPVDFARDVHAILAENCFKCHGGDRTKGGLSLASREALLKGGESGPAVVEKESGASALIRRVTAQDPDEQMPPEGRRLTPDEVGILRAWIDQGLSWQESAPQLSPDASPLQLREVAIPAVDVGSDHPIDKFMAKYLLEHGLQEPPLVDDHTFARRAHLDVVGLLPPLETLAAYRGPAGGDRRAALVDALLADKRAYAEHWMSFWNDHLRNDFKGTGYIDGGRKAITHWLYDALLTNKPYDQFVRELLHPTEASEGFIKGIVWRGSTAAVQRPPMQAAASTAQVFLGINLKCASCHDSFVSNWKLTDSYGLANCFSEEPLELVRCDNPTGKMAEYKFLWPDLGAIDGALPREERMARVAELVTMKENGPFTRTIVNRLWAKALGRGIIEPLDNIQAKPWYPELIDWLARDLIEHDYDLKQTLRLILTARAYQWQTWPYTPEEEQSKDFVFRGPCVRKLSAEQFADAIASLTGLWQQAPQYQFAGVSGDDKGRVRAWRVTADPLTRALGRPNREQVTTRRETISTTLQALELTNGATLATALHEGSPRVIASGPSDTTALIEQLYLESIQREPSQEELVIAREMLGDTPSPEGVEDLLWGIAMLPEFQLIY
ncbi:MAG: PSD1 domain-containing protein [Candidatus Hydrogenedentes bacterium]|nr:PSD1 domain-containing protein [Candidatus Hydrogenedentota bacterium]